MHNHVSKLIMKFNFNKNILFTRLNAHKIAQINQIKSYYLKTKFWVLQGCWMRRRRWCCFLSLWLGLSAFWGLSLRKSLTRLGGIGT